MGFSVALGGDYIVIGAPSTGLAAGRVLIFNAQTGDLVRTITPDASVPIGFGWSVATDGERVLIGSPFVSENQSTLNTGRAFLYEIATGELISVIFPPPFPNPPLSNSRFGISVALSDNQSIISAPGYQSFGIASLYDLPPSQSQALGFFLNPSPSSEDRFGLPVALDGNYVLIGASGEDFPTNNEGVVYVFEANTGRLIQTLSSPSPLELGLFGASVSIDGTTILIGALGDDGGSGAAYLFQLFDPAQYAASNIDLVEALGYNLDALSQHYRDFGQQEGRAIDTFDEISYLAANTDLIRSFGFNAEAATQHYIEFGYFERRPITFDAALYLASNPDLIVPLSRDRSLATAHYIQSGLTEGRSINSFSPLQYTASYLDLANAFGVNQDSAINHYVDSGIPEGRSADSFDEFSYIASYPDLIREFGSNGEPATEHYILNGIGEGRITSFNPLSYMNANPDIALAFNQDPLQSTLHYITNGFDEGRLTS